MKIIKNIFKVMAIIAVTFFATSCNNDDTGVVEKFPTVAEILKADPANFSILEKALLKTDLLNTFRNPGSYTVFAPTNAAFITIGVNDAYIDGLVPNSVAFIDFKRRLQYHVLALNLNGQYTTELPSNGYINTYGPQIINTNIGTQAQTNNAMSLFVSQANGIVLNGGTANGGATVSTSNVQASNGVVHVINAVLELPTMVSLIKCNPSLTTLYAVVSSAPQSTILSNITDSSTGAPGPTTSVLPYTATTNATLSRTIFAPTNDAFTAATWIPASTAVGYDAAVSKVLRYHILNSNTRAANAAFFASQTAATTLTTQVTGPIQNLINPLNSLKIVDSTPVNGNLTITNIQAKNGVIHIVNKVLQPL
jgi:uncharacterized surface protein with fasciclin (FAS1) repeats